MDGDRPPPGYTESSGHFIFDVKMDFICKARYVKDGHLSPDTLDSNFAGVVSRESVRIAFTCAALNGLEKKLLTLSQLISKLLLLKSTSFAVVKISRLRCRGESL